MLSNFENSLAKWSLFYCFSMKTLLCTKPAPWRRYCSQFGVEQFDWSAQSSDLNLSQHLWDELNADREPELITQH